MAVMKKHNHVGRGEEIPKGSVCKAEPWLERGEICTLTKKKKKREGGEGRGIEKEREEKKESAWVHSN